MIIVKKPFKDSKDNFKAYKVGDEHDFGEERNQYIVDNGYGDFVEQKETKELKPELKKKPTSKRSKK